jgi:hypothetical protein
MKKATKLPRRFDVINVKVPEFLTDVIDENLENGKILQAKGFVGRAHFVEDTVSEKLAELNLISKQEIDELKARRARHARQRKLKMKS